MNTHADKTQENKSQSVSNVESQMQSGGESTFKFVDNRPEAIAQRKLQEMANNSQQVSQLRAFQDMANNSQKTKQFEQGQARDNNHTLKLKFVDGVSNANAPVQRMSFPEYESAAKNIMEAPGKAYNIWESVQDNDISKQKGLEDLMELIAYVQGQVEKARNKLSFRNPLAKMAIKAKAKIKEYRYDLLPKGTKELEMEVFNRDNSIRNLGELENLEGSGTVDRNSVHIKDRIGEQSAALNIHDKALSDEAGSGNKNIHGRGRHGFQTGMEGQIKRAQTKVTPDQPSDEMGLGRSIDSWKTSGNEEMISAPTSVNGNRIVEGQPVKKEDYEKGGKKKKKARTRKSGGPYAGSFFSPEHQNNLIATAMQKANNYIKWDQAEFENDGWQTIQYFDVILKEQKGGYGVSFSKGKGAESQFVIKIENSPLVEGEDLDVYLMLCAKVQLKRNGNAWEVLSSFPENLEPGASPIYKHGDDPWTGKLQNSKTGETTTMTPPKWNLNP